MRFAARMILASVALMGAMAAQAETRTLQTWTCTINDGKTLADAKAMNSKWLKFVNGKVEGGGVRSSVLAPITGNLGEIMFVDSYPSLDVWTQGQAAMGTPEGVTLEAEFNTVSTCASNHLLTSTES